MSVYLDTSALVKRYVQEAESILTNDFLKENEYPVTSALTIVEVARVIGRYSSVMEMTMAQALLKHDLTKIAVVALTTSVLESAANIAAKTQLRSLDSIHLACAIEASCTHIVTFDRMQARVAESLGITPVIL